MARTGLEAAVKAAFTRYVCDKTKLKSGKIAAYKRQGWQDKAQRQHDARIVRTIDFERALGTLAFPDRALLFSYHAQGLTEAELSATTGISVRTVITRLREATMRLGNALERTHQI